MYNEMPKVVIVLRRPKVFYATFTGFAHFKAQLATIIPSLWDLSGDAFY